MNIKKLTLYTNQLQVQKTYYTNVLGFILIDEASHYFQIQMGKSILQFEYASKSTPYHFALNIPSYQEKEAIKWLKERVDLIPDENKIQLHEFENWNAKAMYFYDPDKNIVEFIARKNLNEENTSDFGIHSIIEISEIGIPTNDIEKHYQWLAKNIKMEIYSGSMHRFCAIGNERGLFICIDKTIKNWFPNDDKAYSSSFKIAIENKGDKHSFSYENDMLKKKPYKESIINSNHL